MKMQRTNIPWKPRLGKRKGVLAVLAAFVLTSLFAFLALGLDTSKLAVTQVNMQNAVDAASLAAVQELIGAIQASTDGDQLEVNSSSEAVAAARQVARDIASHNGVYVDPDRDVEFGRRKLDAATGDWPITWGEEPYNTIRVTARRDNDDPAAQDAKYTFAFGWAVNTQSVGLVISATAYIAARDIVVVLDYSGSMNYDSVFRPETISSLGVNAIKTNTREMWGELGNPVYGSLPTYASNSEGAEFARFENTYGVVTWKGTSVEVTFKHSTSQVRIRNTSGSTTTLTGGNANQTKTYTNSRDIDRVELYVSNSWRAYNRDSAILSAFGLNSTAYPHPGGSWSEYVTYVNGSSHLGAAGLKYKFGPATLLQYWMEQRQLYNDTPVLWKTKHYPFHAVKEGTSLLCDFLTELNFDDTLGLVTYDNGSRVEWGLNDAHTPVTLSLDPPLTRDYGAIDTIQKHKQAAHYNIYTSTGSGIADAKWLLDTYGRVGAEKVVLVMTDGNANRRPSNWSVPSDWDWDELTDYDGDGQADYKTTDLNKIYAFAMAREAIHNGFTMHTLSVGAGADRDLMEAIAFAGAGSWLDVPGGSGVSQMEEQALEAFRRVASNVPQPKLVAGH